jgi:hypothetical protein
VIIADLLPGKIARTYLLSALLLLQIKTFCFPVDTCFRVCLMVLNTTFNNISVISWRSVLLVEENGGPGQNA